MRTLAQQEANWRYRKNHPERARESSRKSQALWRRNHPDRVIQRGQDQGRLSPETKYDNRAEAWSYEEDDILHEWIKFRNCTLVMLAVQLGRTYNAVQLRVRALRECLKSGRLYPNTRSGIYTVDEIEMIMDWMLKKRGERLPARLLADQLERSEKSIYNLVQRIKTGKHKMFFAKRIAKG